MKNIIGFIFVVLLPFSGNSQNIDSLNLVIDSLPNSIYISSGASMTSNYSGNFIKHLYDQKPNLQPSSAQTIPPIDFSYKDPALSLFVSSGVELVFNNYKALHHLFEISFVQVNGNYSYSSSAEYITSNANTTFHDDVQAQYVQRVFSIGYKVQPSTKHFFASFGVNLSSNFIDIKEKIWEEKDVFSSNSYRTSYIVNKSTSYNFANIPLQIGGGCFIRTKKHIIKPGFYFTPCFTMEYNYYLIAKSTKI